ncbi:MAG: rhodanese-like domain-containing protein, partial [Acidobacteriota bacterium]
MAVPRISPEDLARWLEGAAGAAAAPLIVDVRLKYPYEHSTMTLPGAFRLLPGETAPREWPRDHDIVLYDSDPDDIVAERAAFELQRLGCRVLVLRGGIAAWAAARLPTSPKTAPQL